MLWCLFVSTGRLQWRRRLLMIEGIVRYSMYIYLFASASFENQTVVRKFYQTHAFEYMNSTQSYTLIQNLGVITWGVLCEPRNSRFNFPWESKRIRGFHRSSKLTILTLMPTLYCVICETCIPKFLLFSYQHQQKAICHRIVWCRSVLLLDLAEFRTEL